jgi:VWFA-related protein
MIPRALPVLCVALLTLSVHLPASAQTDANPASQPKYTLQAHTRVVLTDVTVTDKQGNPVHGLKASDFQVFDNKNPQEIASFEEHHRDDSTAGPQVVSSPGIYSNDYLAHPPHVLNILFLDLTNISIEDQMYLNYQLGKFFDALKADEPIAVYARTGGASVLLQGFTSDRALLRAAVRKVSPRFPAFGRDYMDDFQTLRQMEFYLGQIPGRKNVLWFSGGSTFFLRPDASVLSLQSGWRSVYDELETQRIAIYPIDARGLTTIATPNMLAQHSLMSNVAEATGGRAVYDYNGLALAAGQIVRDDGEYYTLTYSPHNFHYDNKWHKVSVTLPGTYYTLSYRRGYFADGTSPAESRPRRPRNRLLANGETAQELPTSSAPIIFQASVREGPVAAPPNSTGDVQTEKPRKGTAAFTVQYALPLDAFAVRSVNGKPTVQCGAAVIAFNDNGTMIAHRAQEVTFSLKEDAAAHPAGKLLPLDLEVDLSKGDVYLLVGAWDMASRRLGTLEIPYHVDVPKPPQDTHGSK